jgi:predicted nucleic-acid-binding protein
MQPYLLDTNILLRSSDPDSPLQSLADNSVAELRNRGNLVYITSQTIIEFWVVATRPVEVNGLGWSVEQTHVKALICPAAWVNSLIRLLNP